MDVLDLLKGAPGLLDEIRQAGVPDDTIADLGAALGQQLGGGDGFDFTDLLAGLDLESFLARVDAAALAEQVGISPAIAESVVSLIGPKIAEFAPGDLGSAIGSLAGKLFD